MRGSSGSVISIHLRSEIAPGNSTRESFTFSISAEYFDCSLHWLTLRKFIPSDHFSSTQFALSWLPRLAFC